MDFHGERRSNQTHQSTTDPEAQLARKGPGKEAKLSFAAHALMTIAQGWRSEVASLRRRGRPSRKPRSSIS